MQDNKFVPKPDEGNSYHEVLGKESSTLEDEREFGDYDAGDDVGQHPDIDAGAVHSDMDRDAGVGSGVVNGNETRNQYGGEHGEYDDVIQPEDDDERSGEDLPIELGGASSLSDAADGGPVAVDETQAIFPGSEENS